MIPVAHQITKLKLKQESSDRLPQTKSKEIETPKVNFPYIINSAIGTAGANFIKEIATPRNKKAVTKQDFENLKKSYFGGRYRPVLNCPKNNIGETPYFDLELNEVIFSFDKLV